MLLLSVVRSSLEYGNEIDCNKSRANALYTCTSGALYRKMFFARTCNEAVQGDMGLDTLKSRRDKAILKWWYGLVSMLEERYPQKQYKAS